MDFHGISEGTWAGRRPSQHSIRLLGWLWRFFVSLLMSRHTCRCWVTACCGVAGVWGCQRSGRFSRGLDFPKSSHVVTCGILFSYSILHDHFSTDMRDYGSLCLFPLSYLPSQHRTWWHLMALNLSFALFGSFAVCPYREVVVDLSCFGYLSAKKTYNSNNGRKRYMRLFYVRLKNWMVERRHTHTQRELYK